MSNKPIQIAIIENEVLFAQTLGAWLARESGLKIAGYAESGNQGWELCATARPDLALVDVEMPDGNGLDLAERLLEKLPDTRIIVMTGRVDPHTAWRAGQIGVHGLIDKTIDVATLGKVIRSVAGGTRVVSPSFQRIREEWLTQPEAFQKVLTNRELAVLRRVTEGRSDQQISEELGISHETVSCHRKSIRRKLELHDDRSLVEYGRKWGIYGAGE